jgi:hypothetical protein
VGCPDYDLDAMPTSVLLSAVGPAQVSVNVVRVQGFSEALELTVTPPAGVTVMPTGGTLDAQTDTLVLNVTTTEVEPMPTALVRINAVSATTRLERSTSFGVTLVTPAGRIQSVTVQTPDGATTYPGVDVPWGRRVRLVVQGSSLLGVLPESLSVAGSSDVSVVPNSNTATQVSLLVNLPRGLGRTRGPVDLAMATPSGPVTNGEGRLTFTDITSGPMGNDETGLGIPARPYRTLGRALMDAAEGDGVRLLTGDYPEPAGVTVAHGIHVLGTEPTTLTGQQRSGVAGITLQGSATVADLKVQRYALGVVAVSTADPPALVFLRSVDVTDSSEGDGVVLGGTVRARVEPSASGHIPEMTGNGTSGIWAQQDAVVVLSRARTTGNLLNGISLSERAQLTADQLVSTDNGVLQSGFTAFGIQLGDSTSLTLTNSTLENNFEAGIFTTPTFNGTLSITGSTLSGNGVMAARTPAAGGVVLSSLSGGTVTVDSTTLLGNYMGIQILDSSSVVVRNGTDIGGSQARGINISQTGVMEVLLEGVRVHDNTGDGLSVDNCGSERTVRITQQTVLERNAHGAIVHCGSFICENSVMRSNNLDGLYGLGTAALTLTGCRADNNGVGAALNASGVEVRDNVPLTMTGGTASNNGKAGIQGAAGFRGRMTLNNVTAAGNGTAAGTTVVAGVHISGSASTVDLVDVNANGNTVGLAIRGLPTLTATHCTFNNNAQEGVFIQSTGVYSATFTYAEMLRNGRAGMFLGGTTAGAASGTLRMHHVEVVDNALNDTTGAAGLTFAGSQLLDARIKDLAVVGNGGDGIRVENPRLTLFLGDEANLCPNPLMACPDAILVDTNNVRGPTTYDPLHADLHDARPYGAPGLAPLNVSNAHFDRRLLVRGGHVYGGSASDPAPVRAQGPAAMTDPLHDALLIDDGRNAIVSR